MSAPALATPLATPVILVTGLSGAGKATMLRFLEDLGYEAVDNLPLPMVDDLVRRRTGPLAIGLDIRSRGFEAAELVSIVDGMRADPAVEPQLVFMWADAATLLRRFTETRRRHPMSPDRVVDGIEEEVRLTLPLRDVADLVVDTSGMALPALRQVAAERFAPRGALFRAAPSMRLTLMSFAFPAGLPREADMVFDARFLRNPHYDPILRPRTGLDAEVAAFVEADPDYERFFASITGLLELVLPRFVGEGKKYATVAVGCSGGRHRSVRTVERLCPVLRRLAEAQNGPAWTVTTVHRELTKPTQPAMGLDTVLPGPGAASGKV